MDDLKGRLAETVAAWMLGRGETPSSISKATGLGRQTIYRLIQGSGDSSIETLVRLAEHLGTSASDLLAGVKPPGRQPGGRPGRAAASGASPGQSPWDDPRIPQAMADAAEARRLAELARSDAEATSNTLGAIRRELDSIASALESRDILPAPRKPQKRPG